MRKLLLFLLLIFTTLTSAFARDLYPTIFNEESVLYLDFDSIRKMNNGNILFEEWVVHKKYGNAIFVTEINKQGMCKIHRMHTLNNVNEILKTMEIPSYWKKCDDVNNTVYNGLSEYAK